MVVVNQEEVLKVRQRIEVLLATNRRLKAEIKENDADLEIAEKYLASLLRTTVKEITKVKSITDHLEDILKKKGKPTKAQELLEEIRKVPGLEETALPTVTTTLIRNSGKRKRFRKAAPNTYEIRKEEEKK